MGFPTVNFSFPIEETYVIIPTFPTRMASFQLIEWLHAIGIPAARMRVHAYEEGRTVACAYNYGIKYEALKTPGKYFIFADNDTFPTPHQTNPFLELPGDVVSCECEGENHFDVQWDAETSFHCPLWRTSRKVLETVKRPWFFPDLVDDGCRERGCECMSFRSRVLDSNFSIRHGGYVKHIPRQRSQ